MCSALDPDHHLQELVLYLMEILNLQSTLILTTPVLIGLSCVYTWLVFFLHYELDSNHESCNMLQRYKVVCVQSFKVALFISFVAEP
jgi:hypothetical protein